MLLEISSLTRLRARALRRPFHVVLVEPEIPPNTGNIARLCAATCCPLHLVGRLGFRIDEHAVRRAGIDYWHLVEVLQHADLVAAERAIGVQAGAGAPRLWLFTGRAQRSYLDADFQLGDALVFGKESAGLPEALLEARGAQVVGIPTLGAVRSLNPSSSAAIALYEALRQVASMSIRRGTEPRSVSVHSPPMQGLAPVLPVARVLRGRYYGQGSPDVRDAVVVQNESEPGASTKRSTA